MAAPDQCPELHNPGVWPYVARCVHTPGHPGLHRDAKGREWTP